MSLQDGWRDHHKIAWHRSATDAYIEPFGNLPKVPAILYHNQKIEIAVRSDSAFDRRTKQNDALWPYQIDDLRHNLPNTTLYFAPCHAVKCTKTALKRKQHSHHNLSHKSFLKNRPMCDAAQRATSSGVPATTTVPPSCPESIM